MFQHFKTCDIKRHEGELLNNIFDAEIDKTRVMATVSEYGYRKQSETLCRSGGASHSNKT